MPRKLRRVLMAKDELVWDRMDEEVEEWEKSIHKAAVYHGVAAIIKKYRPGEGVELHMPIKGGYNALYRLEYKDGSSAAMRVPLKGSIKFPDEKVRYEAATMRYVAAKTTIPVPKIYGWGTADENPTGLGPFIIVEYIEHERTLSAALNDPSLGIDEPHILNPNIAEQKLEFLYSQMANILLQLSTLTFPRIGSLDQVADGQISVSGRPLTMNMNNVVEFTNNIPLSILPTQPQNYSTTTEWYSALADTHLTQLTFQHNDVFRDEEDMRDKYVARQLFRRLAREGRLTSPPDANEPPQFRIFSEDLRPSNVLVDANDRVVSVIDWEFAYAAPAQFAFDPPWWLLLTSADYWLGGYEPFMEAYEPRLATFLRVLEAAEAKMREGGDAGVASAMEALALEGGAAVTFSQRMRRSWEDKTWMISLAARDSWAFDFVFWRYLDRRFFGESEDWDHHARLDLLTEREREAMEPFVAVKMEEEKERILVEWDEERAAARLAEVML